MTSEAEPRPPARTERPALSFGVAARLSLRDSRSALGGLPAVLDARLSFRRSCCGLAQEALHSTCSEGAAPGCFSRFFGDICRALLLQALAGRGSLRSFATTVDAVGGLLRMHEMCQTVLPLESACVRKDLHNQSLASLNEMARQQVLHSLHVGVGVLAPARWLTSHRRFRHVRRHCALRRPKFRSFGCKSLLPVNGRKPATSWHGGSQSGADKHGSRQSHLGICECRHLCSTT